jgi:hypothetical protein
MNKQVPYPPQEAGEYSYWETYVVGLIPVRIVMKWMRINYYRGYGDDPTKPTSFERVRDNGDKMLREHAIEMFPEMGIDYAN